MRQYDEAGLISFDRYDFKGNVLDKTRRVISDDAHPGRVRRPRRTGSLAVSDRLGATRWNHAGATRRQFARRDRAFRTSITYDALNRLKTMRYPASGGR